MGVARGALFARATPAGWRKRFGGAKSQICEEIFAGRVIGVVDLAVLACVLRTTTKKGCQLFEEKSAPFRRKYWLRLCLPAEGVFAGLL